MDATFEDVVKLAEQLDVDQQNLLIYRLRVQQMQQRTSQAFALAGAPDDSEANQSPTREELLQAAEALRQIPARSGDHLLGKYADPKLSALSEEALHAELHAIATEWERELDDFDDH